MRPLMPVLIATCMALTLPIAAQARGGGSHGSHPHASDINVTKSTDKSSPTVMHQQARPKASKKLTPEKVEGGSENIRR